MGRCNSIMAVVAAAAMLSGCATHRKPETAASYEDITLQETVLFDFNKCALREDAKPVLEKAAAIMKANPHVHAVVEGHTDRVGSDAYNEVLAEKRARAVGAYLMDAEGTP